MCPRVLAAVVLAVALAPSSRAAAQSRSPAPSSPWTVTVTPSLNPLPSGFCGAVQLAVVDADGKSVPRDPAGYRVTQSDFDLVVTSPDGRSVVGQAVDADHWSVCACQGAAPGTVGTITATYPARALSERERVRGVTAAGSATFETALAKGRTNPAGCPGAGDPPIAMPAPGPVPVPSAPTGAAPTNFRLLPSVPIIASLGWDSMPGAVSYALWRSDDGAPSKERATYSQSGTKSATDVIPDPRMTYRYTLVARYDNGATAESAPVEFVSPPLVNPAGFTATHKGSGNVEFAWQAAPGAKRYRLDGPGLPGTGYYSTTTIVTHPLILPGANAWKLTTLYQGNYADYAHPSMASAVVRTLPPHSTPWLTKNNGPGSPSIFQAPNRGSSVCADNVIIGLPDTVFTPSVSWMGEQRCYSEHLGIIDWTGVPMPLWADAPEPPGEAIYGNGVDLGVGRRARCGQATAPVFGLITFCYATAHGPTPGAPGFNDFQTITHPEPGERSDFILSMVIMKDQTGTSFLVFVKDPANPYVRLAQQVSLDSEGPKYVPQVCMSCHGGKFNPQTRKVDGASFLPLDPSLLAFASPTEQIAQQEHIRKINAMIASSAPTSAVAAYVRGLYGNAVSTPGTMAHADYVPQGWSAQAGFYRSVVKPYCAMCHLAAPADVNFASWSNFQDNAGRIKAAVCGAHTMPHGELQYKAFWTKDTGPVFVPGLLAATLGYASCP